MFECPQHSEFTISELNLDKCAQTLPSILNWISNSMSEKGCKKVCCFSNISVYKFIPSKACSRTAATQQFNSLTKWQIAKKAFCLHSFICLFISNPFLYARISFHFIHTQDHTLHKLVFVGFSDLFLLFISFNLLQFVELSISTI